MIPRTVQQAIPITKIYANGIFALGNKYSKTFRFTDMNYATVGNEEQTKLFVTYCDFLNSLDCEATTKITIQNRRLHPSDIQDSILIPKEEDRF